MRYCLIFLALITSLARGADVLILISANDAGPTVPLEGYSQPTWILWPQAANKSQGNRLISLPSGIDWRFEVPIGSFRIGPLAISNLGALEWRKRGYFDAVAENLGKTPVFILGPRPAESSLQAGFVNFEGTSEIQLLDSWPARALIVATVNGTNSWDSKAALERKAGGKVLVVEVPSSANAKWTRCWLQGKGWPAGVPVVSDTRVPGLIPARSLMALLVNPERFQWKDPLAEPPDRWLTFGHQTAPVGLVFLAVASVYVLGLGIFMVLREQNSRTARCLIHALVVGPAAIILAGRLTASSSLNQWFLFLVVAFGILILLAALIQFGVSKTFREAHPLWSGFAVGLITCAGLDPTWSMFSHTLGGFPMPVSPEAFGALVAYAAGTCSLISPNKKIRTVVAVVVVAVGSGLLFESNWIGKWQLAHVILPVSLVFSGFISRLRWSVPTMLLIGLASSFYWPGLTYAPGGLVIHVAQVGKNNCAEQIAFLLSPTFMGFALAIFICGIAGDHFFGHQLRRALAFSPLPLPMMFTALCFAVVGIFVPIFLHAALATSMAGGASILYDAIRTP